MLILIDVGPLVGGFAVHYGSWRWTMWITLLGSSIVYTLSYFLSETHKATILRRRLMLAASIQAGGYPSPHSTRVTDGDSVMSGHGQQRQPQHSHAAGSIHNPSKRTWRDFWACVKEGTNSTIVEAGKMLVLEKLVTCLGIYLGFIFGCFYAQLVAFPIVYTKVYGLDPIGTGFTSMAIFGGMFLAGLVAVVLHLTVYKRAQHRVMMGLGGKVPPEERLGGALVGSMVLPIALFVCAWSERASVHWSVSILGGVGVGFGLFSSLLGITLYLQDVYPAEQLISVFSAAAALQYLVGAVFPLFVSGMYETMSVGWAGSVFAFVSLVFVPVPWVLWRFGRDLRAESRWGVNVFCEKERR
ncbi:major facilitator superfamily domain-containing protein [Peziza echinospora]|nr:major facilitator superfamily domain-containing protein [Peziza echinospora]